MTTFNLKLKKTSFFEQTIVGSSIKDVTAIWVRDYQKFCDDCVTALVLKRMIMREGVSKVIQN
jgi:hypothetical protein